MLLFSMIAGLISFQKPRSDYENSFMQPYFVFFTNDQQSKSKEEEIWESFVDKYKDDESLTLTKINCDGSTGFICQIQLQTTNLPVFAVVRRAVVFQLQGINSLEDLEKELQNEENYDRSRLCRIYPTEVFVPPYIIYNTTENYLDACNTAIESSPDIENPYMNIYLQKAPSEGLYVKTGYSEFTIEGGPTKTNLHYAISEFRRNQFQDIPIKEGMKTKRRLAYFITNVVNDVLKFEHDVDVVTETTLVCRITGTDFNSEFSKIHSVNEETELPAVVLFNKNKDKWMVIPKINDEAMNMTKLFVDHNNGDFDDQMNFDVEYIEVIDYKAKYKKLLEIGSIAMTISFVLVIIKSLLCRRDGSSDQSKIE